MRICLLSAFLLCNIFILQAQDVRSICFKINELNNSVRDGKVSKILAKDQFKELMAGLDKAISPKPGVMEWVFPLQGYKSNAIGGSRGNGYQDKGYNYFDGNKHLAHPAHDIFINDRNQDDLDDKTHQPVNVLAVEGGIVVACSNEWSEASTLRGGRYVWIYHPVHHIISYYAHNRVIFVSPGDEDSQGQKIAEVGRTGFNAFKKRSPTHLHFGTYQLTGGLPVPFNSYAFLIKAKTK